MSRNSTHDPKRIANTTSVWTRRHPKLSIQSKLGSHQLVPHMSHPPTTSNTTPTYWSASQILANHDNRIGDTSERHYHHGYNVTGQEYGYHVHPTHKLHEHHHHGYLPSAPADVEDDHHDTDNRGH